MWQLFVPDIPISEKILRSLIIYIFLMVAFRLTGKRQVGEMTPFDLVVLLIISNVLQNAMIGDDVSLGGGMIGAATVLLLNQVVVELTYRSKYWRRVVEGTPTVLVHNGRIYHQNLQRERVSFDDLTAALRLHGVAGIRRVHWAILEENGRISVIMRGPAPDIATDDDDART